MNIAIRLFDKFRDLVDVAWPFDDGQVPRYDAASGKMRGYTPVAGMANPMVHFGDMIANGNLPGQPTPTLVPPGQLGQVLQMQFIPDTARLFPTWGPAVPTYPQQPYSPPASGTDTMPETATYVRVPALTGDLTLTLRDAYNLAQSVLIIVKAGALNGHSLTLAGQDGNTIDGAATHAIPADNGALQLLGDANNGVWRIVGAYLP